MKIIFKPCLNKVFSSSASFSLNIAAEEGGASRDHLLWTLSREILAVQPDGMPQTAWKFRQLITQFVEAAMNGGSSFGFQVKAICNKYGLNYVGSDDKTYSRDYLIDMLHAVNYTKRDKGAAGTVSSPRSFGSDNFKSARNIAPTYKLDEVPPIKEIQGLEEYFRKMNISYQSLADEVMKRGEIAIKAKDTSSPYYSAYWGDTHAKAQLMDLHLRIKGLVYSPAFRIFYYWIVNPELLPTAQPN